MNLPAAVFDELVAALADEVASNVAERLAERLAVVPGEEPWRLLTLEEAAARLTRSTRWLRERVKRGEVPHVRLDGGALAFDLDDVKAFAQARRIGSASLDALAERLQEPRDGAAGAGSRAGRQPRRLRVDA